MPKEALKRDLKKFGEFSRSTRNLLNLLVASFRDYSDKRRESC